MSSFLEAPGSASRPLRVAIIGAGPAAFYAANELFERPELTVEIDMFDRLPTPYGLARGGVAPDHQKIKTVTGVFDRIAARPGFRFFGFVELGKDITVADLRTHYHQVLYATGAQTDRRMEIPGEDLLGSHPATAFVGWYNGHPDYRDYHFDLSAERVAIVGVGNVAIDVARILCKTPEELAVTDIADYALDALSQSRIREVHLLGRRGPTEAAFTNPEIIELGELAGADIVVSRDGGELDELSRAALERTADHRMAKKVEILNSYMERTASGKPRLITVRFLVSPVELSGDPAGRVASMRLVRNELYATPVGTLRPRATDRYEDLPVDLVFRSVGYHGMPLPGVPFNEKWGVIPNERGRVLDPDTHEPRLGEYTSGWIKRGPSGVLGTNKSDSLETVECMMQDLAVGKILSPEGDAVTAERMIRERQPQYFTYDDWRRLSAIEESRGHAVGRPRVKFARVDEMRAALASTLVLEES